MKTFLLILNISPVLLLAGIAVLIVLITVCLILFLRRSHDKESQQAPLRTGSSEEGNSDPSAGDSDQDLKVEPAAPASESKIRMSLRSAMNFLRENSTGRQYRYRTPWFLVVGSSGSGKTTLVENTGISLSLREGTDDFGISHGIRFKFFDPGVIVDVPGDFFLDPGALGGEDRKWKSLLRNLQRQRPQRPIDGLVLTLPCTELIGEGALSPALIGQRAAHIHHRLWQLQKWFGMCFPVYVIVTKCDLIPGFRSLAQQVPARYRREMFGWPNPYNLEVAFESSWVEDAFEELAFDLNRLQSEIFVERRNIPEVDELFLFSEKLQRMKKPVRLYLGQIFKRTAYQESLQFRGIYFSGDADEFVDLPAPTAPLALAAAASSSINAHAIQVASDPVFPVASRRKAEDGHGHKPIFLTDLFEAKIFPERGIAHPISKVYLSKDRTILTLQIASAVLTVVLIIGGWVKYESLMDTQRAAVPMLQRIVLDLRATRDSASNQDSAEQQDTAFNLIHVMQSLTGRKLKTIFFPTSLLRPIDDKVKHAMVPAFEKLVFSSFRQELESRRDALLRGATPPSDAQAQSAKGLPPASTEEVAAYQQIRHFTTDLQALEQNIGRYNHLATRGKGNPQELILLESYLHGHDLPADFDYERNPYFRAALAEASGKPIEVSSADRRVATEKMRGLVASLFSKWIAENPLIAYLDGIGDKLDALDAQQLRSYTELSNLKGALVEAQSVVSSPRFAWMGRDTLDLTGPLYDVTILPAEHSQYLSPDLREFVEVTANNDFEALKAKLADQRSELTGEMLEFAQGSFKLSQGSQNVRLVLENLLNLPFVQREGSLEFHVPESSNERLFWNKDLLQQASSLKESFDRFVTEQLENTPATIRTTFREIALRRLEANMVDLIARAKSLQPAANSEQPLAGEIRSFQDAAPVLGTLLEQTDELVLSQAHERLLQVSTAQASGLLLGIDHTFQSQLPYTSNGSSFDRWNGENTPSKSGFDVGNPDEMGQYLSFQRQQVQEYAAQATPLVAFLDGRIPAGAKEPGKTVLKWRRIIADLQKYNSKVPGTSLASLEDYLRTDLDKVAPESCPTGPLTTVSAAGDYFLEARETIRRSLSVRCQILAQQNAIRQYARVAALFNQHLAGRFPFAAVSGEPAPSEADPEDVLQLYRELDSFGKSIRAGLQSGSFGAAQTQVLAFMNQMDALRPLFTSLFTEQPEALPVLDFVPVFRVNQRREIKGNEIMDWTLQVGSDTFRYREPERAGRWTYGQPVKLTLRWAKDSPEQPASVLAAPDAKLRARSVTFEYSDGWSLLSMLLRHQAAPNDFDRMVDPEPQTLVFTVANTKDRSPGSGDGSAESPESKVFIRVKLRSPGKPDNLRLRGFPSEAPRLESTQAWKAGIAGGITQ